jgi:hypothetical protein
MTAATLPSESGSSLPELLLATALTVTALSMLATTVLGPLSAIARWGVNDERQVELEQAADRVAAAIGLARPGLDAAAILSASTHRVEVRAGHLRHGRAIVLRLDEGRLSIELPDGPIEADRAGVAGAVQPDVTEGVVIDRLDLQHSRFVVRAADGQELLSGAAGGGRGELARPALSDVAVIEVVLVDPDEDDGAPGRTARRSMHLRLRLPLAGGIRS